MKVTRKKAWKIVRGWRKTLAQRTRIKISPDSKVEREMVDYLMLILNRQRPVRVSYGAIKELVLKYGKRHEKFTVDDLLAHDNLPERVNRKSLIADLHTLRRQGLIHLVEDSTRGRKGAPRAYALAPQITKQL